MVNLNNEEMEQERSIEDERKYVVFRLEEEYYGIDINNVKGIEKAQDFTRVPNANYYIKGVINLRGEVVPVIDLRKRLGFHEKEEDGNSRIIIVQVHDMQVGLLVDSSSEVITFAEDELDSAQTMKDSIADDFVKYIGKKNDRLIILIDLMKVVGYEVEEETV
ncbi:chemotaxis protein CheW [Andreesenia angusta]|uniref:Chemotaxis protein CheW n=1 Tax=Andreesenia angusta TaxID=39480 RepID=A0A1S1V8Q5_9FIRM|nr:chemotaxis protein CheW [Andreesenia angusta]OHW62780.1 chemotaxis protein CheW [Andreesenia angusta]